MADQAMTPSKAAKVTTPFAAEKEQTTSPEIKAMTY